MKKYILFLLVFPFFTCFSQSRIKAKQYASENANKIMADLGSSKAYNLTHEITDIETENEKFIIEMDIKWNDEEGVIMVENAFCEIKGVLTINFDGTNKKWEETYRNNAVNLVQKSKTNRKSWGELAIKASEKIIENSDNKKNKYESQYCGFEFINLTEYDVEIYISHSKRRDWLFSKPLLELLYPEKIYSLSTLRTGRLDGYKEDIYCFTFKNSNSSQLDDRYWNIKNGEKIYIKYNYEKNFFYMSYRPN